MPGWTRPVRMLPKSSLATETALSIFSSASRRVSSIIVYGSCGEARGRGGFVGAPPAMLSLADLEAGESLDRDAACVEHLRDGQLVVLHERLLDEHHVLEEGAEPTLDDLRDRLLGLALVTGDLLGDPPLLLHHIRGHLIARGVHRAHGGNLLRQVLGHVLARLVQ